jgi:hypothetical protein
MKDIKQINTFAYFAGFSKTVDSDEAVFRSEKRMKMSDVCLRRPLAPSCKSPLRQQ